MLTDQGRAHVGARPQARPDTGAPMCQIYGAPVSGPRLRRLSMTAAMPLMISFCCIPFCARETEHG